MNFMVPGYKSISPQKKKRGGGKRDIYAIISDSGRNQKKEVSFKLGLKMKNE